MQEKRGKSPKTAKTTWFDSDYEEEKKLFYEKGLHFTCTGCSTCCRYESGYVFLSKSDVSRLLIFLKMDNKAFLEQFCRWIPSLSDTEQLSLDEKSDYDCVFWSQSAQNGKGGCLVYDARPLQCRAFPFWSTVVYDLNSWKATSRECPGMDKGALHTKDSIEKWLAMRRNEPIITRGKEKRGSI